MEIYIRMIDVGNAESILVSLTNNEKKFLILVDSGNRKDAAKILTEIENFSPGKNEIDLAISTHLDGDHIGGFIDIINRIKINEFWIHDPKNHASILRIAESSKCFIKNATFKRITESVRQSRNLISELRKLESKNKIEIKEPFAGYEHSQQPIKVLGPTEFSYNYLVKKFNDTNGFLKEVEIIENNYVKLSLRSAIEKNKFNETNETTYTNDSSIIFSIDVNEEKYLFTGDAGIVKIKRALDFGQINRIHWLKIPHHGSIKNLSPQIIEKLNPDCAFVSAEGTDEHPNKIIIDSLEEIGCSVFQTNEIGNIDYPICFAKGFYK